MPVVVVLPAEIDVTNSEQVYDQLAAALAPGVPAVVADLTSTSFCDSSGVHAIMRAHESAAARDVRMLLAVSSATSVRRVLELIGVSRIMPVYPSLPDALDLLVVCVESGLGLDAAMRKVCDEMKDHAKTICEELSLANFQLQMGRPRREVLHDLGVRTGVDDVRSLAAILIQADRFGSSIAQALRVQSDSMRTRRKQLAEEKAAKTAVQLLFPLILFIFPGIFVVLVGPAAIAIMETMFKN